MTTHAPAMSRLHHCCRLYSVRTFEHKTNTSPQYRSARTVSLTMCLQRAIDFRAIDQLGVATNDLEVGAKRDRQTPRSADTIVAQAINGGS